MIKKNAISRQIVPTVKVSKNYWVVSALAGSLLNFNLSRLVTVTSINLNCCNNLIIIVE